MVLLGLFLLLLDVFLGVGAYLSARPCADMLLHTLPILPVYLDRLVEPFLLLLGPAARRGHFHIGGGVLRALILIDQFRLDLQSRGQACV